MKQKLLFLLTALMLLTTGNAWGTDVPYSIGESTSGYRTVFSDPYTVKNGETLHITFTNNNYNTTDIWRNYVLEATSAVDKHDVVYFDLRSDNYAFGQGTFVQNYNGNCLSDLNGATVDNYITYVDGVITVNQTFTKAEVTTYNRVYTYTVAGSPKSVVIYVTVDHATVTITNAETSKWSTVWTTDFSSAPAGMTYSISAGSCNINNGYLWFKNDAGSGARTQTASFTDAKFNVDTNWIMEFDWNCGQSNNESSNVSFATNNGNAFTLSWKNNGNGQVTVTDASSTELSTTLPVAGYNIGSISTWSHIVITGDTDNGIYLTITNGGTTYVNNVRVTSTYGYPVSFNGTLGKSVAAMGMDNIVFKTPPAAGFVATPTSTITGAVDTDRKFTLECLTAGATIYYATSDLEKGAAGWITYAGEVTTDATTIYAYAEDDDDNTSDKMNFATGAGTIVDLAGATVTHSGNGQYTIANSQTAVLGNPTATVHYQIDGGAEQTSTSKSFVVNIATDGTLTYWLTADGYGATGPADDTVYAARAYAVTTTIDFKTSNSNEWATKGDEVTVTGDTHTYYKYKDQSGNILADGLLATTFEGNSGTSWRIQRYYGGTKPYAATEYIALKDLTAGQIIQIECTGAPAIVSNLTAVPASTYTGTYTYTATADGDVIVSIGTSIVLETIKLCETSVSKTITSAKWATYCSPYILDFSSSIANLTAAYIITGVADSKLTLVEVDGTVPANTGLLLKGEGACTIPVATSSSVDVSGNKLVGVTSSQSLAATTGYVLMGSPKVGFYKNTNAFTLGANTAYLPAGFDAGARTVLYLDEDDAPMAINAIEAADAKAAGLKDGKYLINGRIVMVNNGKAFGANGQILK